MKVEIEKILDSYLIKYPNEIEKLSKLKKYLKSSIDEEIVNWNNVKGHITAGAFIYSLEDKKFLVLYHKDLQMYLYAGGHSTIEDTDPLDTAKREAFEETGIDNFELFKIVPNDFIPIDIDIHIIPENEKCNMPEHIHFDFRYLFVVNKVNNVTIDKEEFDNYKWISIDEINDDLNYGKIAIKIRNKLNMR